MIDTGASFLHFQKTKIVAGPGNLNELPFELKDLGIERPLVVSDQGLVSNTDIPGRVLDLLDLGDDRLFASVEPETSMATVERGTDQARGLGVDGIVSVGGGSAIDTAKAMTILLSLGGTLRDYEGYQSLATPLTPHLAIPTTAGTGSEVTIFSVIWDEERQSKLHLADNALVPHTAILDPELVVSLPPELTAGTGMDVVTHAIEALQSTVAEPFSDACALHALKIASKWLSISTLDGVNLEARSEMLIASALAGFACSNAQVGLAHAMAHTFGPRSGVHHGSANAIVLPAVIDFNSVDDKSAETYHGIATAIGLKSVPADHREASAVLSAELRHMRDSLGLPACLADVGVQRSDLNTLAEDCLSDGAIVYNPRPVDDATEILPVWESCYE